MEHPTAHPLRKDLSYRKPVPVYVPTPPPSPFVPPVSPVPSVLSLNPTSQDLVPPLPDDWRENIELASTRNASTLHVATDIHPLLPFYDAPPEAVVDMPLQPSSSNNASTADITSHITRSATPHTAGGNRKTYLTYRPPTPPVQARRKRQHVEDVDPPFLDSSVNPFQLIYPDMPLLHGNEVTHDTPAVQSMFCAPGVALAASSLTTLNADRILRTEKSQSIHASTDLNMSTTWFGSPSTCNSTLGDNNKRRPSGLDLRKSPSYHTCGSHRHPNTADARSGSLWGRRGVLGWLIKVGMDRSSICNVVCCLSGG